MVILEIFMRLKSKFRAKSASPAQSPENRRIGAKVTESEVLIDQATVECFLWHSSSAEIGRRIQ